MTVLELAALAGISRAMETSARRGIALRHGEVSNHPEGSLSRSADESDDEHAKGLESASMPQRPSIPQDDSLMPEDDEALAEIVSMPDDEVVAETPSMPQGPSIPHDDTVAPQRDDKSDPFEFLRGAGDAQARYYRASDEQIQLLVAFLSDGRMRLIDTDGRRFAGMLETEKADLIEIDSNEWSRVFVSATPDGRTQLELQGGPHDTHVLICEALPG